VSASLLSILVVDDSTVNRLLVAATLRRDGYRILEAEDGGSGLDAIARENPDLVILDFMMPEMDGAEMMRRLRARSGSSPPRVLLMTALDATESAIKARELGADAYLVKPYAPLELRARVKELLAVTRANPAADAKA
jgi:DNA-binding response OmpR family regulator